MTTATEQGVRAGWRETTHDVAMGLFGDEGLRNVEAWRHPRAKGLLVTAGVGPLRGKWVLTHKRSGLKLYQSWKRREDAMDAALLAAEIADWTASKDELRRGAEGLNEAMRAIAYATNGCEHDV